MSDVLGRISHPIPHRVAERHAVEDRAAQTLGVNVRHCIDDAFDHLQSIRMGKRGEVRVYRKREKGPRGTTRAIRLEWQGSEFGAAVVIDLTERATVSLYKALDCHVRRVRKRCYTGIMDEDGTPAVTE